MGDGGTKYNFTGPQASGIGTCADILSTIKQLVFDEKRYTGKELLDAVRDNWEGMISFMRWSTAVRYITMETMTTMRTTCSGKLLSATAEMCPEGRYQGRGVHAGSLHGECQCGLRIRPRGIPGRKEGRGADLRQYGAGSYRGGIPRHQRSHRYCQFCDQGGPQPCTNGTLLNWKFPPECVAGIEGRIIS